MDKHHNFWAKIGLLTRQDKIELQNLQERILDFVNHTNTLLEYTSLKREKNLAILEERIDSLGEQLNEIHVSLENNLKISQTIQTATNETLVINQADLIKKVASLKEAMEKIDKSQITSKDMESIEELLRLLTVNHFLSDVSKAIVK